MAAKMSVYYKNKGKYKIFAETGKHPGFAC